jgi:hypothetical protein
MLPEMKREIRRTRILAWLFMLIAAFEAIALAFVASLLIARVENSVLIDDNMRLQKQLLVVSGERCDQLVKYYSIKLQISDGYRKVLKRLVDRFGLDRRGPKTVMGIFMKGFDEDMPAVGGS